MVYRGVLQWGGVMRCVMVWCCVTLRVTSYGDGLCCMLVDRCCVYGGVFMCGVV